MANLNSQNIGQNYKGILNLDATTINTPLDATLRAVTDGMGNSSALSLSTAAFKMSALTNDGTIVGSIFNSTKKVVEFSDRGAIFSYAFNGTNPTYSLGFYGAFDSGSLNLYGQGGTNGVFLTGYPVDNYILNNLIIGTSSAAIIKLGGSTSAFPAIKRNAAAIDFRLADDSGYANITAKNFICGDNGSSIYDAYGNQILSFFYNQVQLRNRLIINSGAYISGDGNIIPIGGTTSSFPAIKRNGAAIDFRLADDSGYADIRTGTNTTLGLITFDTNGSGRGRAVGLEQIVGTSGAGGVRIVSSQDTSLVQASAQLQVDSTTKGFLPPRMTTTQKNAISTPAEGLIVMDITLHKLCMYNGSAWETITSL